MGFGYEVMLNPMHTAHGYIMQWQIMASLMKPYLVNRIEKDGTY